MWEHYKLDHPMPKEEENKHHDPEYDEHEKEASAVEGYDAEQVQEEGRLPIQDHENFEDPDFDDEWNKIDEPPDMEDVGENPQENPSEPFGEERGKDQNGPMSSYDDDDEWEEV